MNSQIQQLSLIINKNIFNRNLEERSRRSINISGLIIFIFWITAVVIFIIATTYVHNETLLIALFSIGSFFVILGFIIPLIWIMVINLKIKKYYVNIFNERKLELFKLLTCVFEQAKIYEDKNKKIFIEQNGRQHEILLGNNLILDMKFRLARGKTYHALISENISIQIAQYLIEQVNKLWEK